MPHHFFTVRSTVADATQREAFDAWYRDDHLPKAIEAFGAGRAWRFWSASDPSVHLATYRFADRATLDRAVDSPRMKELITEFDHDWPDVKRTREITVLAEECTAS